MIEKDKMKTHDKNRPSIMTKSNDTIEIDIT